MKKLAIISTYGELCGIAGYTYWLKRQLEDDFEIDVLPLPQKVLKRQSRRGLKVGDQYIKELAEKLKNYDYVNLQFEPGTLASDLSRSLKRYKTILNASPRIAITFHTVERELSSGLSDSIKLLVKGKLRAAVNTIRHSRVSRIWNGFYQSTKQAQRKKTVSLLVHTKREHDFFEIDYGFKNVFDHPLSFLKNEDVDNFKNEATREKFGNIKSLNPKNKYIGLFGFIAPYKGISTAIQALSFLPENYHVLLFGAVHPNEIKKHQNIDPYLKTVLDMSKSLMISQKLNSGTISEHDKQHAALVRKESLALDLIDLSDIVPRVHFMGNHEDDGFLQGIEICDYVVAPYQEVGQSASGPMTMAIEMGAKLITSRTLLTKELRKYFPEAFLEFDTGNYQQLAEFIYSDYVKAPGKQKYNWKTNRETYISALEAQK